MGFSKKVDRSIACLFTAVVVPKSVVIGRFVLLAEPVEQLGVERLLSYCPQYPAVFCAQFWDAFPNVATGF
jgi:hypothetical protein